MTSKPFKTRYAVMEPGPLRSADLSDLTWVDVELPVLSNRRVENRQFRNIEQIDLRPVLGIYLPGVAEHVRVNGFKEGPADMFVAERSATGKIHKNDAATVVYWTATVLHWIAENEGEPKTYAKMHKRAIEIAAQALKGEGPMGKMREDTPRVYGRAVLFEDQVWW